MTRTALLATLLTCLTGCPSSGGFDFVFPACAGRIAANPRRLLVTEKAESLITIEQPVSGCDLDPAQVRARAMLIRPDNTNVPAEFDFTPYDVKKGQSSVTVKFTPDQAGTWELVVSFETGGRVQVPIDVAKAVTQTLRHKATLPVVARSCGHQPWRTSAGAVLCQSKGMVLVQRGPQPPVKGSADELSFEGSEAVVVGNTVWSWSLTDRILTRRTDTGDGGLRIDATSDAGIGPILHATEDTVILLENTGLVRRADFVGGGVLTSALVPDSSSLDLFFSDDAGVWKLSDSALCPLGAQPDGGACRAFAKTSKPIIHATDGLWLFDSSTGTNTVALLRAPLSTGNSLRVPAFDRYLPPTFQYPTLLSERESMVLGDALNTTTPMLVAADGDELTYAWYGDGDILGTRDRYVVIDDSTDPFSVTFVEY